MSGKQSLAVSWSYEGALAMSFCQQVPPQGTHFAMRYLFLRPEIARKVNFEAVLFVSGRRQAADCSICWSFCCNLTVCCHDGYSYVMQSTFPDG